MPHYPVIKTKQLISVLNKKGFYFDHQKGSHARYTDGHSKTTVPMHKEIDTLTLKSILKQTGISLDELKSILRID